ncbi:deoxyribonuclease IV [Sedimentibacter hydroxybenzoicus DSM 7310]|uniref:Probable endonuclease 4 n=1 Tax=Sedimentibacter hydroxybenzoicus DSM 7310 TaxID=1123245 RepID=A0A974BNI3_SEDHY|nr:deoxyribonuclease IV [Sedimentibacter hydroxybenzoicus]NYB76010.1 deoxyribonuclease IV [Sedimentibacter hydroxybenzoicus DSM 7310]
MLKIGCHLSVSNGYEKMGKDALKIGANTFQYFTRNPRGSKAKSIDAGDAKKLRDLMEKHEFAKVIGHAPYTLNICSADERTREFALEVLEDDLVRMEFLPNNYYNFHPGSHVKQGVEVGIKYISDALNKVIKENQTTIVLLETMSGKGTEIGRTFEELRQIIDGVNLSEKVGVCLDTCHVFDSGYDIVNDLDGVINEFDRIIGLDRLYAIHLNDSKNPFNSQKDRHETIGDGQIGLEAITRIINHPELRNLPFVLETPNELDGHAKEIKMLREAYEKL